MRHKRAHLAPIERDGHVEDGCIWDTQMQLATEIFGNGNGTVVGREACRSGCLSVCARVCVLSVSVCWDGNGRDETRCWHDFDTMVFFCVSLLFLFRQRLLVPETLISASNSKFIAIN